MNKLTPEQKEAYDHLGKRLDEHTYIPVKRLEIRKEEAPVQVGQSRGLTCRIFPANATRTGLIWETSDPEVATIDKFGVLDAHKRGEVVVRAYSWDDANPSAKNNGPAYVKTGIKSSVNITISK